MIFLKAGVNSSALVMTFVTLPCFIVIAILEWRSLCRKPSRIIIENNILMVERPFLKPIVMPLIEITSINTYGFTRGFFVRDTREIYIIKCNKKEVTLHPLQFKFASVNFDKFVAELKAMVANAKREASDSRDNGIN